MASHRESALSEKLAREEEILNVENERDNALERAMLAEVRRSLLHKTNPSATDACK